MYAKVNLLYRQFGMCSLDVLYKLFNTLCKKASNHHANLPLEMYSFTFNCNHLGNTWKPM